MTRISKQLAIATALLTVVLFAVGGLVRGSGSGLGCSTWPACEPGHVFPSGAVHSLIEFSHRTLALLVVALSLATAVVMWRTQRSDRSVLIPALLAFPLTVVQAVVGAVVVWSELDPRWVTVHFVTALVLIADVVVLAVNTLVPNRGQARHWGLGGVAAISAGVTGLLLLVGTYVRARGPDVGLAFRDWPLMDGRLVPTLNSVTTPMFVHRALALAAFSLALWVLIRARTARPRDDTVVTLATAYVLLFVAQIAVGAANVVTRLRPWAVVLHVALSVLVWATGITLAAFAVRSDGQTVLDADGDPARAAEPPTFRDTVSAYVALTKPRIIVLLLITTVPAMILAASGLPSAWLVLATLAGGTLAAGSANAINMYLDRDIDQVMRRTRSRPLPGHRIEPQHALRFGFTLGAVAFAFLASFVNGLAATLALSAIAFYVFVYTMWLKRTTDQNIVIGGAAGAVPVLVGWAAVTGGLAWPAWVLFAVVFVWTPPHFWALAMRVRDDYAAAGVPMMPVVRGEVETRRQILLYALVLFCVTLLLVPVAHMGPVYAGTAVVLGGVFVYRALVLWRSGSNDDAWRLFKYSVLYLAALFGAVAVDALIARSA
jgi:heme o synthase